MFSSHKKCTLYAHHGSAKNVFARVPKLPWLKKRGRGGGGYVIINKKEIHIYNILNDNNNDTSLSKSLSETSGHVIYIHVRTRGL